MRSILEWPTFSIESPQNIANIPNIAIPSVKLLTPFFFLFQVSTNVNDGNEEDPWRQESNFLSSHQMYDSACKIISFFLLPSVQKYMDI